MNLLHVIGCMDPKMGGISQAIRTMAEGLTDLGWKNEIVTLDAQNLPFLAEEKTIIHAIGPSISKWRYNRRLSSWLRVNILRFDVIIVHGLWQYHGYATRKAVLQSKNRLRNGNVKSPKLFVMPHGMLDPYFQRASGRKLKALRNRFIWKFIEKKLVNESDGLLFTCQTEYRLAQTPFRPYCPKRECVIGLGNKVAPAYSLGMSRALLEKCPELGEHPFYLFLGRIHEKKGVDLLINAYKFALVNNNSIPKLLIAGPGRESEYGQYVQRLVDILGLTKNIIFGGMLSGDAKWGAFYGCEVFVLPSHQENFGIAVVEALACSRPVLISNQVNIWREIQNSNAGIIADDTLEGIRQLLTHWSDLPVAERKEMEKNAKSCFELNFAIAPASTKLLKAIDGSN